MCNGIAVLVYEKKGELKSLCSGIRDLTGADLKDADLTDEQKKQIKRS